MKYKKIITASTMAFALALTHVAFADDANTWQVGVRAIDVVPAAGSSPITGIGGHVTDISSEVVPELDINYYITNHLSSELILATTRHSVEATKTAAGNIGLGSVGVLPPTVTLLYHFLPSRLINPYFGAGVNYTDFYNASSGKVASAMDYTDSFGPALQAGFDINLNQHWAINVDAKKIFMGSNVTATVGGDALTTNVHINPMIYGLGLRYRF